MTKIAAEKEHLHVGIAFRGLFERITGSINTAIVDDYDFVVVMRARHHSSNRRKQRRQSFQFVVDGNYY